MNLPRQRKDRPWLVPLTVILAVLLWAPEQLWSSRRVLFWVGLVVVFLGFVLGGWCLHRVRRVLVDTARGLYLRVAFRAAQRCVGP